MTGAATTVGIRVDGVRHAVPGGISVAAALLSLGVRELCSGSAERRRSGIFCGMGVCFECLVTIDGVNDRRACLVAVADGMRVDTG